MNTSFYLTYLFLPVIIWACIRFGIAGASFCNFVIMNIVLYQTLSGIGPLSGDKIENTILQLSLFIMIVSATTMTLAGYLQDCVKKQSEWVPRQRNFRRLLDFFSEFRKSKK